jgi:hypothetical protein
MENTRLCRKCKQRPIPPYNLRYKRYFCRRCRFHKNMANRIRKYGHVVWNKTDREYHKYQMRSWRLKNRIRGNAL